MTARPRRPLAVALAGLVLACVSSSVSAVAPAHADETTDAPVTVDDAITVRSTPMGSGETGFGDGVLDVLANDSDPDGDELAICRVEVPDGAPLVVERAPGDYLDDLGHSYSRTDRRATRSAEVLVVQPSRNVATTVLVTYFACDHDYLTPATVRVTIRPTPPVRGRKVAGKPGRVRFTNPGDRGVVVLYGGLRQENPDGRVRIAPGRSALVRVERRRLVYVVLLTRTGMLVNTGRVKGIRLPGDRPALQPVPATSRQQRAWRAVSPTS